MADGTRACGRRGRRACPTAASRRWRRAGRRYDPGEVREPTEVADDRRQRGGHDGLVERGQQHAEHQPAEDGPDPLGGHLRFLRGLRARPMLQRLLRHGVLLSTRDHPSCTRSAPIVSARGAGPPYCIPLAENLGEAAGSRYGVLHPEEVGREALGDGPGHPGRRGGRPRLRQPRHDRAPAGGPARRRPAASLRARAARGTAGRHGRRLRARHRTYVVRQPARRRRHGQRADRDAQRAALADADGRARGAAGQPPPDPGPDALRRPRRAGHRGEQVGGGGPPQRRGADPVAARLPRSRHPAAGTGLRVGADGPARGGRRRPARRRPPASSPPAGLRPRPGGRSCCSRAGARPWSPATASAEARPWPSWWGWPSRSARRSTTHR